MLEFGREYTSEIVANAQALGQALYECGLNTLAESKGFTKSHQIAVDTTKYGLGGDIERALEKANIIVNRQLLPGDIQAGRHYQNPGGIRLGVSEITRLGMKRSQMAEIAQFIKRVVVDKEPPEKVKSEVALFRKDFQKVHYAFETARSAYEYIKIRQ